MEVNLIDYTGHGHQDPARHAANVLVFTKNTRLNMVPGLLSEIEGWSWEKVNAELEYMANTIPSSWEFVTYTFCINAVSRAFTHQFVRTRTGSYAQQTMRVLDVDGWTYETGPTIPPLAEDEREWKSLEDKGQEEVDKHNTYHWAMQGIAEAYNTLISLGAKIEDARGVLPTNIHTNIIAKFDLRTLADTARKRASGRTQGEYRKVLDAMIAAVIEVHPWASLFFNRTFDVSAKELEQLIQKLYAGTTELTEENRIKAIKLIDQMRATA